MISCDDIVNRIPKGLSDVSKYDLLAKKYTSWRKLDQNDLQFLNPLGQLQVNKNLINEVAGLEVDYWSPNSPIALTKYPYYGCEIYKHVSCPSYYLIYTEFGGHAPERRCRLFLRSLVVE